MFPRLLTFVCLGLIVSAAEPIRLHPQNPHYYFFRGKPTVLIGSTEHYGAVLNRAFDYQKYLDTLQKDGLNLTRTLSGVYREIPGSFNIHLNTLAPKAADFISPYARVSASGGNDGLGKFDLTKWNPEYFSRLTAFIKAASDRGIVVELSLFCTFYNPDLWRQSPLNAENNAQGIGAVASNEPYTLKDARLQAVEEELVKKIAAELRGYDNLIYEIINEPYFEGPTLQWQRRIAAVLKEAESGFPTHHLIAQNIANNSQVVTDPDPNVSVLNFHYARPPIAIAENYWLERPISYDETGFDGNSDFTYRIQGWDFIMAGGAQYDNLDYSFAVGHEDGTLLVPASDPGGGSPQLRTQLGGILKFLAPFDVSRFHPDNTLVVGGLPATATAHALADPGRAYAVYIHNGELRGGFEPHYAVDNRENTVDVRLNLPAGNYSLNWWDPKSSAVVAKAQLAHPGGHAVISAPKYRQDIALQIVKTP